jgi:hypothetical protein
MPAKMFFVFLTLSLLSAVTCDAEEKKFDLTSVRAKDLKKVAEEVHPGASPDGLNELVHTVVSPDGKRTATAERVSIGVESIVFGIYVSSASSEARVKIAEVVNWFGLCWSPDGSKIAFSEGTILHVADSDGQTRQVIYIGPGGPYPGACFNLKWSGDGKRLSCIQVENARDVELSNPVKVTITLGMTTEH